MIRDAFGGSGCRYVSVRGLGARTQALLDAIRRTRDNGGVLHARLRAVDVRDEDQWFRAPTILEQDASFRELLDSDALRQALPELRVPTPYPLASPPRFVGGWGGSLTLDGELALVLVHGGAYTRYSGTAAQAKALAREAVDELVQDRHEDFDVYSSEEPWTPWFFDVAWDQTWFLVDRRRLEVTVLCMTDTD